MLGAESHGPMHNRNKEKEKDKDKEKENREGKKGRKKANKNKRREGIIWCCSGCTPHVTCPVPLRCVHQVGRWVKAEDLRLAMEREAQSIESLKARCSWRSTRGTARGGMLVGEWLGRIQVDKASTIVLFHGSHKERSFAGPTWVSTCSCLA